MPNTATTGTAVVYNGYLYYIGGNNAGSLELATVEYAQIASDGSLVIQTSCPSGWTLGGGNNQWCYNNSSLFTAVRATTSAVYNGFLYVIGGAGSSGATKTVEYAQLAADGSLVSHSAGYCASGWTLGGANNTWCYNATSLTTATSSATAVSYNGYIYEIGGNTGITTVEYVPINSDGSLGTWSGTNALSTATEQADITVYNGYIYVIDGVHLRAAL